VTGVGGRGRRARRLGQHPSVPRCWPMKLLALGSVVPRGDGADQAAIDLAVGLALGAPALGIGPGRRVVAQPGQDDEVQGRVELAVPGAVEPNPHGLAAGGRDRAAPPRIAKVASLGQRPAYDQAHSMLAATIGPTRCWRSRSGRQARTSVVMAPVCSAIWRSSRLCTAGQGAQAGRGRDGLDVPVGPLAQPPTGAGQLLGGQAAQAAAKHFGRGGHQRVQLPLSVGGAWTAERRAASRVDNAARCPLPLARRAGRGPAPHGPPWWHRSGRTWRHAGGRRVWAGLDRL
jgi:hypothetical protein